MCKQMQNYFRRDPFYNFSERLISASFRCWPHPSIFQSDLWQFLKETLAFYLCLPSRRETEIMLQSSPSRDLLPTLSPFSQSAKQLKIPAGKGIKGKCQSVKRLSREDISVVATGHYIGILAREAEENHYKNGQIPEGSVLRCQDEAAPPYRFCQLNTLLVMSLACTAFTEGADETPYNSNINLIKNSINKGCWSGGVLQINQNSLQFSPVVLMIHWSFSRKLRILSSSLQELS